MIDLKSSDLLLKSVSCLICLIVCSCQDPVSSDRLSFWQLETAKQTLFFLWHTFRKCLYVSFNETNCYYYVKCIT